ncbi:MAG: Clp1/GlmU family protein [Thermodesulfobacteriota bacterium]
MAQLEVLPEWEAAARRFLESGGVTLLLGGVDTGKSTLSRYLIYRAFTAGEPAALVDLDLGQSHLGPPATLGLGLFPPRFPGDDGLFPEGLYFVGQTSPVGAILDVAVGCRSLVDLAGELGAARVVVNTCGLIHGPAALRLKRAKLELLRPRLILALEREGELGPLLRALGNAEAETTMLLPVSGRAAGRPPEERRRYREERFRQYFYQARPLELPLGSFGWQGLPWGQGQPLSEAELQSTSEKLQNPVLYGEANDRLTVLLLAEPPQGDLGWVCGTAVQCLSWPDLEGQLAGLLDRTHRTLALGLILPSPWDQRVLTLLTPLPSSQASRVRFLRMGKMKLTPAGRELSCLLS